MWGIEEPCYRPFYVFFLTFDLNKLVGKIRRRSWKERLKIGNIAKFESDLLKNNEDIAPQNHEILQAFVWWGDTKLAPIIQMPVNFRNFGGLHFKWCRPIFPNLSMSIVRKPWKGPLFYQFKHWSTHTQVRPLAWGYAMLISPTEDCKLAPIIQTPVNFRNFAELYFLSLKTYHFQICHFY